MNPAPNTTPFFLTDLLGKCIRQHDDSGTREGICRAVFIDRDASGSPKLGMVLETTEGFLETRYWGSFRVLPEEGQTLPHDLAEALSLNSTSQRAGGRT